MFLGAGSSKFLVQVDTGSSDLVSLPLLLTSAIINVCIQWLTSTSCSSSLCNQVGGQKYDPSQSSPTGRDGKLTYAQGEVDGPIVWDSVRVGGYGIANQARGESTGPV